MQVNPYKETEYPTWNIVKRLAQEGRLTPEQSAFAAPTKPVEELYDIEADPDAVHNLADDPAHEKTLSELRANLDEWLARYEESECFRARCAR